jgi:hypothetical protein
MFRTGLKKRSGKIVIELLPDGGHLLTLHNLSLHTDKRLITDTLAKIYKVIIHPQINI